jgi:hypothetical protein
MPILFGGPNLNSVALKAGFPSYYDVIAELSGVSVPVKVVLEVFNVGKTSYTNSALDSQCYKAGTACPEQHIVCAPEYCEIDVWKAIIAGFKAASPGMVTVLGSVDSDTEPSAYDDLDMDGVYLVDTGGGNQDLVLSKAAVTDVTCSGAMWQCYHNGVSRLIDGDKSRETWHTSPQYETRGGCTRQEWVQLDLGQVKTIAEVKIWHYWDGRKYCGQKVQISVDATTWTVLYDTGSDYGDVETEAGKTITFDAQDARFVRHYCSNSNYNVGIHILEIEVYEVEEQEHPASLFTVSAIGAPLFDETAVDDADVYVTLSTSDLGIWNPFSWYPYTPASKWAAIVTEATDMSAIPILFDRGYGWVYLTSEGGYDTKSTLTSAVIAAIEATATTRRLQGRRLERSENAQPFWGCDDTLLECKPICMKNMGAVTSKVSDKLCAGAPMDQCACKCFHAAQWTCDGSKVVCKAKYGAAELQTVGDKVCEMRGAPKPTSTAELRIASDCKPMTEMRGSAPAAECIDRWGTPEPRDGDVDTPEPRDGDVDEIDWLPLESFAAPLALAAITLYS